MKRISGTYEAISSLRHFIPAALPPRNPSLELTGELATSYGSAMQRLGQLNEVALRLPNPKRFMRAYVLKEALLSSAIEGIHTTLMDVFTQPLLSAQASKETQLVLNYTRALDVALALMKQQGLPLVSRVIVEAHQALMHNGVGDKADPGNYRKQSVRVGALIPPPAPAVPHLMSDLEKYINGNDALPLLVKAGLVHVQFETIHPFLDGNGRIGRLLIVLMLVDGSLLPTPIIYPSYYLKKHSFEYYQRLNAVETKGDFEGWIQFYLKAIEASAFDAYQRAREIEQLERGIKAYNINDYSDQLVTCLFECPVISITELAKRLHKSYNTAHHLIQKAVAHGLLIEVTKQKRNKLYRFEPYLRILEKEYDEE